MACDGKCIDGLLPRFDPGIQPLGCYGLKVGYDKSNNSLNGLATLNDYKSGITFTNPYFDQNLMDPGYCLKHCIDFNFSYAALTRKTDCYCGNETALETFQLVDEGLCNYFCTFPIPSGNVTYKCGGDLTYTVFEAKSPNYPPSKITVQTKLDIMSNLRNTKYKYKGCIRDSQYCTERTLNVTCDSFLNDLTIDKCLDFCKGHKWAGMESSNQCFCGEDFDDIGLNIAEENCGGSCSGNISQICGGSFSISMKFPLQFLLL